MRIERFAWEGAAAVAGAVRAWATGSLERKDVSAIERQILDRGDAAVLELTARFDAPQAAAGELSLRVPAETVAAALDGLDPALREALEVAAANIRAVAEAQPAAAPSRVQLPQGQTVALREVAVGAAGVYAPGGRAAYPSSVLMCALPARVAGVARLALATPPGPDGSVSQVVLAAAGLAGVNEVYAMGGAQAIFALAHGTETVAPVDVIVGPGNAWVQEAKRAVHGHVGIESYAGPSELMIVAGENAEPKWAALDLCAQAEHGEEGPPLLAAVEEETLAAIAAAARAVAAEREIRGAPLAMVRVPDLESAVELANAFAPEHLELLGDEAATLAGRVASAGCVFAGRHSATAFGDYVAGSNHVLPTGGSGRFSGPLGPDAFRRKIATVEVRPQAAAKLGPYVETIARAEGFPVHGESAMIRSQQ